MLPGGSISISGNIVAEAGASPLEPYNGAEAVRRLAPSMRLALLCASDPFAVLGVMDAFGIRPDIVAGPAANTTAAVELVQKLVTEALQELSA